MLDSKSQKPLTTFQKLKSPIRKSLIYQMIFHPIRSFKRLVEYMETHRMNDDEKYFYLRHKAIFGYKPDFKNPKTFNEKIIHRMLYDRNPIYTYLADKLKARIYIASKLQGFTQSNIINNSTIDATRERERERVTRHIHLVANF